jgi:hypothetical protein
MSCLCYNALPVFSALFVLPILSALIMLFALFVLSALPVLDRGRPGPLTADPSRYSVAFCLPSTASISDTTQ